MTEPVSPPAATIAEHLSGEIEKAVGSHIKEQRSARFDLDVRGFLAIITVVFSFALAFVQLLLKGNADIPAWSAAVVAGVTGFYFGGKGGSGGGNGNGNGKPADKP